MTINVNLNMSCHGAAYLRYNQLRSSALEESNITELSVSDCIKSIKSAKSFIESLGYKNTVTTFNSEETVFLFSNGSVGHSADSVEMIMIASRMGFTSVSLFGIKAYEKELILHSNQIMDHFSSIRKTFTAPKEENSAVHVLVQGTHGLTYERLGTDYSPLVRGNYSEEVLLAYDRTVSEFSKEESDGFISIFSGPPGTGKSYLLRSLIGKIDNALFLYVPANLISNFSGPSLIGVLNNLSDSINIEAMELKEEEELVTTRITLGSLDEFDKLINKVPESSKKKNKIVLILEDADEVLAPRSQTDMAGINSILNLTDGILGKILNIRIIATTNSESKHFDNAIIRPGRLCTKTIIGKLSKEMAQKIYEREGGKGELVKNNGDYVLAELYKAARDPNYLSSIRSERVGF